MKSKSETHHEEPQRRGLLALLGTIENSHEELYIKDDNKFKIK